MSTYSKQLLHSLLGLFEDACSHLESSIGDFKTQTPAKAMKCLDSTSGINMSVKDAIVMVTTAQNTVLELVDMLTESNKMYSTEEREIEADQGSDNISELSCRLEHIETKLSALHAAKHKTDDDITDMKQWRENVEIEQNNNAMNIEQLSKKQKQNFKNLRKQLSENDNKVEEMNKKISALNEELSKSNKTIEMVSQDIKTYENNLRKINNDLKVYKEETDSLAQEIKNHSGKISVLQEEGMKSTMSTRIAMVKLSVMCQMVQQRLAPLDKLLQMLNQNSLTREKKLTTIENLGKGVIKQKQDSHTTVHQLMKHSAVGFIAIQGLMEHTFRLIKFIKYECVQKNLGKSFDLSTGTFTAPVDGLYIVSLTIEQTGDGNITAGVTHTSDGKQFSLGTFVTTQKSENATGTFLVWMRPGDTLFSWASSRKGYMTKFICFLLNI